MKESHLDDNLASVWCLDAKTSLANVHRFSPLELMLGQNPNLPSKFSEKPVAYVEHPISKILTDNCPA